MLDFLRKKRIKNIESVSETLLYKESNFVANEAYKLLRTNISFTLPDTGKCRIIGITSAIRGETKSTTSINLSYVLAQTNKRVLLIEADLRLPSIAKKMEISGAPGLSDALITAEGDTSAIKTLSLENWHVLVSGSIPPNPSEMLGSPQMGAYLKKLAESYDFIIVDLPPVNLVSDALAISSYLDGMIVVVRCNYSERRELNKCLKSLELAQVKVLGITMTSKRSESSSYSRYKKYRKGGYYHSSGYYAKSPYYSSSSKSKLPEAPVSNSAPENTEEAQPSKDTKE